MKNIGLEILDSARSHGSLTALRHKREGTWREWTFGQMAEAIEHCAAGLVELGIKPGDRVGIFSPNLPEWLIADYAVMSIRAVTVPIYATNTAEQLAAIARNSGLRLLLVGSEAELSVAREAKDQCPALTQLIVMDEGFSPEDDTVGVFRDLLVESPGDETVADIAQRRQAMAADDLATIIYTSGTTGQPKGVKLVHANFTNQVSTLVNRFEVGPGDVSLCFLPLSHVYERAWSFFALRSGATNSILSNPKQVVATLAEVRPNVMVSAPRLYDKIHAAIMAKAEEAPPLRRRVFAWALGVGHEYWSAHYAGREIPGWLQTKYRLADKLVLTKIRNVIGGPKKVLSSGGAALDSSVEEFFLKIGLLINQGYGLTETAPMLTCNYPGKFKFGTVGTPVDEVEIRIADSGEIQVKGPNVTSGYFGMPEADAEAFTEGWFRTGDIGHVDDDGFLVITDRLKDLIVTAGGKNIAPQRIETLVGKDHFIEQVAVVGDKRKFVSAIIVPSFENLVEFAKQKKLAFKDHDELIKLPEVVELFTSRIRNHSVSLAPFEKIKRFTLVAKQFSQKTGEITPTLKVRRKVIAEKYRQLIERMYASTGPDQEPGEGRSKR